MNRRTTSEQDGKTGITVIKAMTAQSDKTIRTEKPAARWETMPDLPSANRGPESGCFPAHGRPANSGCGPENKPLAKFQREENVNNTANDKNTGGVSPEKYAVLNDHEKDAEITQAVLRLQNHLYHSLFIQTK